MVVTSIIILILLGMVVGFFAGLFGIGGGAIMVPALTAYFLWLGMSPEVVVHLALATSMSCIVINAIISIRTHQQHQAILWPITYQISPAVLLGSGLATYYVIQIPSKSIALIFMILMVAVAVQMIFGFKPKTHASDKIKTVELLPVGFVIGFLSALIAIGGGSLTVPYLSWHRINIKKAIATAASIGLPLAMAGCFVFIIKGIGQVHLPDQVLGYVYWPATLAITAGSLITTSYGAHLTHRLPIPLLKRLFAGLIVVLALRMYFTF